MNNSTMSEKMQNQKWDIMSEWKRVNEYSQRDLKYIWKDIKPEFESIKSKGNRPLFILKKLREFYGENSKKYSEEISTLDNLIMLFEYNDADNLRSLMESGLFSKIFTEAEKESFKQMLELTAKRFKEMDVVQKFDNYSLQMPLDLQRVKIGLRKIWVPTISGNLAVNISAGMMNRLNSFFMYISRNLGLVSEKILISSILAATVIGFSPERTGGGYIRLKSDKEIIQQVLGADFEDEKVQKILEASRFGDILADIMNKHKSGEIKYENLPDYIKELISDGVLDIAVFIGAGYEEHITLKKDEIRLIDFAQNKLLLRVRYVDNIEGAVKAFDESDIIYVKADSNFGLGWALSKEGMANPLRMQPSPIRIPKKELHGYKGTILKDLVNEVIVQASDEDIRRIKPRKGYQLIAMASCKTSQYFLDVIKRLRQGLPTTVIYTNSEVYNQGVQIFLNGILKGEKIEQIVEEINAYELKRWTSKDRTILKGRQPYEALVLNAESGSPESTAYDKHNIPNSLTLFYDIEL